MTFSQSSSMYLPLSRRTHLTSTSLISQLENLLVNPLSADPSRSNPSEEQRTKHERPSRQWLASHRGPLGIEYKGINVRAVMVRAKGPLSVTPMGISRHGHRPGKEFAGLA